VNISSSSDIYSVLLPPIPQLPPLVVDNYRMETDGPNDRLMLSDYVNGTPNHIMLVECLSACQSVDEAVH